MDATQMINDSFSESDEEDNKEKNENKKGQPLAKLRILKNEHIPETELLLFLGDNVMGRDPNTCTLPLSASSISKQHATISLSVYRRKGPHNKLDIEALIWDLGSMNGTRKGHLKLTPNVRYALSEQDSLVVADIPCQYVSCSLDTDSSKGYKMTSESRNSGVNANLRDASGEEGGDSSTESKKCVIGASKSQVSLPGKEDISKTPVRSSCLSFEQTPTQPQGTLVPESDLDSDEERRERRLKAPVTDSDSYISSPTCSSFLSPTNKIVPESEDESSITPSSSSKNEPSRHVSFSMEKPGVEMGQQRQKNKNTLAIVSDSDEEEERAALEERESEESEQHVPRKQESNVSLTGEDEMPVFSPAVLTDAIPVFDMDSDTDMEEEEEMVAPAGPVTLNTNQPADQPPNSAQFHMDSDSDVDETALHEVLKSAPSSADYAKPPHVISVIQAEGITMDSDTDMDDDDVSDAAIKAKPTSLQSTHLDSDTDIDEEEENQCGTNTLRSKIDENPTRLDIKPTGAESAPDAPHSLNLDSDTDDEAFPAAAISELSAMSPVTESITTADAGADLGVLSDSDTDEKTDSLLLIPVVVSTLSVDPGTTSEALRSDSDADTDVDETRVSTAGDAVDPASLRVDSDTHVEDEVDFGEAGENQISSLHRVVTPGFLVPLQQNCSTPVQVSEGELEDMETQAFLIPSSGPFRHARPIELSPCTNSLEDDLCIVAETQSFILQTRGNPPEAHNKDSTQSSVDEKGEQCIREGSFQLGLSDSSHLEGQAQALAMESTQAFVSVREAAGLEDNQEYADRTSLENNSNLQAYGEDEEPARCPVMSEKEGRVDLDLEATQAYISESNSETDDERKNIATAETQPFLFPTSSTLVMAETQPMFSVKEDEESLDKEHSISSVLQVKSSPQHVPEEREEHEEAAQPQKRDLHCALSVAETQPMHVSENEESEDEDLIPQRRRAKPQPLEKELTQTLANSDFSLVETQPMHIGVAETQPMATSGNEESDIEDSIPGPRKRKAKQLRLEDEQTQTLTNSELSIVETQPMDTGEDGDSDEEDFIPGPRKRRAKPLQLEETQSLTISEVSQPISDQSDEEVSTPGPGKRKEKARHLEGEETRPLTISEVSAVETQPMVVDERRAKTIQEEDMKPLTNPEASTVETKTVCRNGSQTETETGGTTNGSRRRIRARLREEEEEQPECSEPVTRPTRGRREKSRPDEEEKEVEQAKRTRGKKYTGNRKDSEEEEEMLETKRNRAENNNLIMKQEQDKLNGERKVKEERLERERKEKEERLERLECEKTEREENERIEKERNKEEKLRLDREKAEREDKERIEKEKRREEKLRLEREKAEREEKERIEKEKRKEEKLRLDYEKAEREEKERKKEEKLRLECEKAEREKVEREQNERTEKERKKEKTERVKTEKEQEEILEIERKEQEEQQEKEAKENKKKNNPKTPAKGGRAARCTAELHHDSTRFDIDDVPARRTRSRSNSSNSVNSEMSVSSVTTQGSRGRAARRTGGPPPPAASGSSSSRRRTVAAEPTQQDRYDASPRGALSRSNSTSSEISSCSLSSRNGGRGGRQRGRGRKTESHSIPPINSQSGQNVAPTSAARGRKGRKAEEYLNEVPHDHEKDEADSMQASTTRGRQRADANASKPAGDKKAPSSPECASAGSPLLQKNGRGRGRKVVKNETAETPVATAVSDGEEAKGKRNWRKRELEANMDEDASCSSKMSKVKEKAQTTETAKGETKDESQVQVKRKGRASSAQAKKNVKDSSAESEVMEESEKMEVAVGRRGRSRPSVIQKLKKEEQEESGASFEQDSHLEDSEPQTPTSSVSRKRQALVASSPVVKTRRASSASPAADSQLGAARQAYKVLFTGVVDEEGERVLARLGGSMAKGVADMNFLVTDKVRRTVKFLCAVARGVPIVNTHWLNESGKAGSFLSPNAFLVKDPEQEKKFNFCLQESLRIASSQPLLQGYEVHVTKSVKPEPVYMKDIISCSGATFLPKMPASHKPQTVVISCEEDWLLCGPALSVSLPVITAEFILTGILRQKLDLQTHKLSAPVNTLQLAGGRGRSKKKT